MVMLVAVPADAWPEPLPPVVHAAIATPMAVRATARIARTTTFFFLSISKPPNEACRSRPGTRQSLHRQFGARAPTPKRGLHENPEVHWPPRGCSSVG